MLSEKSPVSARPDRDIQLSATAPGGPAGYCGPGPNTMPAMDAANFDATMHALRHWAQTTLTEAGFDSRQIADRGGHTEALMKAVYIHRTDESEQKMTSHLGSLLDTPLRSQEG